MAKGTETKVDKAPTTAAPVPAMWPRGFMAKELRLPTKIPKQYRTIVIKNIKKPKDG